MLLSDYVPVD
jgi:TBC1 domain family member 2